MSKYINPARRSALAVVIAAAAMMLSFSSALQAAVTFSVAVTSTVKRGESAEITITANGSETNPVSVDYATVNGTALAGTAYTAASGTVVFFPGASNPTTFKFTVPILANAGQAGTSTFTIALTNGKVILPNLGTPVTIADTSTTVTIPEIAAPPVVVSFAVPTSVSADRSRGTASVIVTKTGAATNTFTIDYATENGTGTAGVDYTSTSGQLRFAFGETTKEIVVPLLASGAQTIGTNFRVRLSNPLSLASSPEAVIVANSAATVTILTNDGAVPLYVSAVPASTQGNARSFLRIFNSGSHAAGALLTLYDGSTGNLLAKWTSPGIAAGAIQQYDIATIESGADRTFTKPASYFIAVQATFAGSVQHVVYRPAENLLTNQSICSTGTTTDAKALLAVHTKNLGGFLSSVVVSNTGSAAAAVNLGFYDAQTGIKLGTFVTPVIPARGHLVQAVDVAENAAGLFPGNGAYYIVRAEGTFTGHLQHLVLNRTPNITTDMTATCSLPSQ